MVCDLHFEDKGCACPKAKERTIYLSDVAFEKMINLSRGVHKKHSSEVMFFLLADRDNPYFVKDIVIPMKQKLSGASAETDDGNGNSLYEKHFKEIWFADKGEILIGTGHSHPSFSVNFSGTDHNDLKSRYYLCVNEKFPFIDIVVNNSREINCRIIERLECDDFATINDVSIVEAIEINGVRVAEMVLKGDFESGVSTGKEKEYNVDEIVEKIEIEKSAPVYGKRKYKGSYYRGFGYEDDGYYGDDNFVPPGAYRHSRNSSEIVDWQVDDECYEPKICVECGTKMSDEEWTESEPCDSCGEEICPKCVEKISEDNKSAFELVQCKHCRGSYGSSGKYQKLSYEDVS